MSRDPYTTPTTVDPAALAAFNRGTARARRAYAADPDALGRLLNSEAEDKERRARKATGRKRKGRAA